ncbi:MAG TPA: hypothetical protein VN837_20470 [Chloroflexota bacterium]|nr:hypothetical protein [Chloroflexota bacterium]
MYPIPSPEESIRRLGGDQSGLLSSARREGTSTTGPLHETFQTLAFSQEEQEREAADLLEREIWAVTRIMAVSTPIWNQNPSPVLSFSLGHLSEPAPYRLELSRFAHLRTLRSPSPGEQALIASDTPCWARVAPNLERHLAGYSDALACSYVPIPVAEAVKLLGLGRIMTQIEAATQSAGQAVLNEARAQEDRRARLMAVERMLGCESNPDTDPDMPVRAQLALALLGKGRLAALAPNAACLGLAAGVLCFLAGFAQALIVLLLGVALMAAWALYVLHTSNG